MNEFNIKKIVFSSSVTVYGDPKELPIKKTFHYQLQPLWKNKVNDRRNIRDLYVRILLI